MKNITNYYDKYLIKRSGIIATEFHHNLHRSIFDIPELVQAPFSYVRMSVDYIVFEFYHKLKEYERNRNSI